MAARARIRVTFMVIVSPAYQEIKTFNSLYVPGSNPGRRGHPLSWLRLQRYKGKIFWRRKTPPILWFENV